MTVCYGGHTMARSFQNVLSFLLAASLLSLGYFSADAKTQLASAIVDPGGSPSVLTTGSIYSQPIDPNGKLLLSAWLDPDGSNQDQYIWDNFTLQTSETVTEIDWLGVYDPLKFGAGGLVVDFSVSIYPSIAAGTEPALAFPPLVTYQTGGSANETTIGTIAGTTLYSYAFTLPVDFAASAGVKYWVQIEASQSGSIPDWCLAPGSGGNNSHYQKTAGAGGDVLYRSAPGDAAFTLLGPVPDVPTPTDTPTDVVIDTPTDTPTYTATATDTPTNTPVDTATNTPTDTPTAISTNTATDTPTATATDTPTNTPVDTPTNTPTDTPTATPTDTPTDTPTSTSTATNTPTDTPTPTPTFTDTPTNTPVDTPTDTPTFTPTFTATNTPTATPLSNTPGKVTGGGVIGSGRDSTHVTFGFVVSYSEGDSAPKGNMTYQDHKNDLRLKVDSFDLLVIDGEHAWFTGTGTLKDGQVVQFTVNVSTSGQADRFSISIPSLGGYMVDADLTGGNITIR